MKSYIVVQMIVVSEKREGHDNNIVMETIVRQVLAESEEQAIGKFVIGTSEIKANKKLNIECYELGTLKKL